MGIPEYVSGEYSRMFANLTVRIQAAARVVEVHVPTGVEPRVIQPAAVVELDRAEVARVVREEFGVRRLQTGWVGRHAVTLTWRHRRVAEISPRMIPR